MYYRTKNVALEALCALAGVCETSGKSGGCARGFGPPVKPRILFDNGWSSSVWKLREIRMVPPYLYLFPDADWPQEPAP